MTEASCLRIYLTESSEIDGKPALETILGLCRNAGLRGVSVLRGVEGLGQHGIHSVSFLALSNNLPLIIDAIDTTARVEAALQQMQPHLGCCTVATWPVSLRMGNIDVCNDQSEDRSREQSEDQTGNQTGAPYGNG